MTTTDKLINTMLQRAADNRAHGIATISAIVLIQSEGHCLTQDRYYIDHKQVDDMMLACIEHLKWHGHIISKAHPDGSLLVEIKKAEADRMPATAMALTGQVLSMAAMMEKALEILKNVEAEGGHDEEGLPALIEKAEAEIAKVLKDHAVEVPSHG